MCDLQNDISFRGVSLNDAVATSSGIVGNQIETIDHSEVAIRQFREPLALKDGIDVGGVWLGARIVRISGVTYGSSRSDAMSRIASLEAVMLPVSGTFGFYALPLTEGTVQAQPQGLRVVWDRRMTGGDSSDQLGIPWSVVLYCADPGL